MGRGGEEVVDTSPWFLELHARLAMEKKRKPTFVEEGAGLARVLLEQRDNLQEVVKVRAEYVSMLEGSLRGTVASLGRIQAKREALEEDLVTARGMAKEAVDALERMEAMLVIRGEDAKVESKLQVDSICAHEGACGCVLEVLLKYKGAGGEVETIALAPERMLMMPVLKGGGDEGDGDGESISTAGDSVEVVRGPPEEPSHGVGHPEYVSALTRTGQVEKYKPAEARLVMVEKFKLAERYMEAELWGDVEKVVRDLREAWRMLKAEYPEGQLEDRFAWLEFSARLLQGRAWIKLNRWNCLVTLVGDKEFTVTVPRVGEPGATIENCAVWFLLRATYRFAASSASSAVPGAEHDCVEVVRLASQLGERKKEKLVLEVRALKEGFQRRREARDKMGLRVFRRPSKQ